MLGNAKLIAPIVVIFTVKTFFDTADPTTVHNFRLFFALCQVLFFTIWIYVWKNINTNPEKNIKISVQPKQLNPPNPISSLFKPSSSSEDNNEKANLMTIEEYDKKWWKQKLVQTITVLLLVPLVHWKFGLAMPLVMSSVINLLGYLDDPLVKIFVFQLSPRNHPNLKRPFSVQDSSQGMLGKTLKAYQDTKNESTQEGNASPKTKRRKSIRKD